MITRREFMLTGAALPVLSYLSLNQAYAAIPKNTLVMAFKIDEMTSIDPHEAFEMSNIEICGNVYQRLLRPKLDDPNQLQGEIADSWTVSDDAKTYTFKLKPQLVFADGTALTADDVVYSLRRLIKLNKGPALFLSQFGYTPDNIDQHVSNPDPQTVIVTTPESTSPNLFLYCLSSIAGSVVCKKEVEAHASGNDMGNAWLNKNSAGSGAYAIQAWKASESIILKSNTRYPTPLAIERIIIKHVSNPAIQLQQLEKGDIDIARNLGSEELPKVKNNPEFSVVPVGTAGISLISLNQKNKYLSHPKVWEAFKYAIDYDGIQKNIFSLTKTVNQVFLPQGFPAAIDYKPFKQDIAKAKALMAEAGFANGFTVTLDHNSAPPTSDFAQIIQANLAQIGVKVSLVGAEMRQVLSKMRAREHELAISSWAADYFDPNNNAYVFCVNLDNSDDAKERPFAWRSAFQDQEMAAKAIAARDERDPAKRNQLYAELQKHFAHNSPFVIMFQDIDTFAALKQVQGFRLGVMSDFTVYSGVKKA